MLFWLIAVLLGLSASALLYLLSVGGTDTPREEAALAIFKDQLAELDRDRARGLISKADGEAAEIEIKRRMLATAKRKETIAVRGGGWPMIVALIVVPAIGLGTYALIGSPKVPSQAFADRIDEREGSQKIADLAAKLRSQLEADENGGETKGWTLLAQTYLKMQRYPEAANAFGEIIDRPDASIAVFTGYAEAAIASENGFVSPQAAQVILKALQISPNDPAAIFYHSYALEQAGEMDRAYDMLSARMAHAQGAEPWLGTYQARLDDLGAELGRAPTIAPKGPTAADIEAASELTAEEQQEFIRSMVGSLASRLENETPNDIEGWLRLTKAYRVLGETENSAAALERARALAIDLPADDPRRLAVQAMSQ